jgi:hypothetical protein
MSNIYSYYGVSQIEIVDQNKYIGLYFVIMVNSFRPFRVLLILQKKHEKGITQNFHDH